MQGVGELQRQQEAHKARISRMVVRPKVIGVDPAPFWPQMWMWDLIDWQERLPIAPKIEDIIRETAGYYKLCRAELLSDRRTSCVVIPRQVGMYLAKTLTRRSYPEIGRRFGNRDHTTVLYAVRKIELQRNTHSLIDAAVTSISRRLGY